MLHTALPCLLNTSDLKENTENVVARVKDVTRRPIEGVWFKGCTGFVSDSCNGMRDVWRVLVEQKIVSCVYGCVTHYHNNCCEEIYKESFLPTVKEALFVAKTMRRMNMVQKVSV